MTALGSGGSRCRLCRGPWADHYRRPWGWVADGWALPARPPARPGPASVSGCALQGAPGRDRPRFLAAVVPPGPGDSCPLPPALPLRGVASARHQYRPWCCAPREAIFRGTQNGHGQARVEGRGRGPTLRRPRAAGCRQASACLVASENAFRRDPPGCTPRASAVPRPGPGRASPGCGVGGVPPGSGAHGTRRSRGPRLGARPREWRPPLMSVCLLSGYANS